MTPIQLEGMAARSSGSSINPYPKKTTEHLQWRLGYDTMDDQIRQILDNARSMLSGIRDVHRLQSRQQSVKA
jgi:hypothetical protein